MSEALYYGDVSPKPPAAKPIDAPGVHAPGIFFGLPDSEYHAAFALSASGIKNLRISPLDFWARSVLNPDRKDEETEALIVGKAYHKRIVEGKAAFDALYAPRIEKAESGAKLFTIEDLKSALKEREQPTTGKKDDLIARLVACDPPCRSLIWDLLTDAHDRKHAGKALLPADLIRKIEYSAAMIEKHPQLCKAFSGGMPEVSVFWFDEDSGVPCKARFDYLKPRAIVDLKTYENSIGAPISKAIARTVASYKYHIQARFYLDAANEARKLISAGEIGGEVSQSFLDALVSADERTFLFVFQQKGVAPLARGKIMPEGLTLDLGRYEIDCAKGEFQRCWQTFGADPWIDTTGIETFDSTEFPAFISD